MSRNEFEVICSKIKEINRLHNELFNENNHFEIEKLLTDKKDKTDSDIQIDSFNKKIGNYEFNICFLKLDSVPILSFDSEYNVIPKYTALQYEVSINIIYKNNSSYIQIDNIDRLISQNKEESQKHYDYLVSILKNNNLNLIINYINESLDKEIENIRKKVMDQNEPK